MQHISFETTVKKGFIKIPKKYSGLDNRKVSVEILPRNTRSSDEERAERVKNVKEFLRQCSGILKNTNIPADITPKEIKEMRIKERYGI